MMRKFLIIFISSFIFFSFFISWIIPCYKNGLFEVREGEGLSQVAQNLKEQGFIQAELPFNVYILCQSKAGELKSGAYLLTSDDTFLTIAKKFIDGETHTLKITIPEGFTLKQIDARLAKNGLIQSGDLMNFNLINPLEGYLFPDTYYFSPQREIKEIVEIFLENFDRKLTSELREEIGCQNRTIFEIITMASLIEKEVRSYEDKRLVSGVLWKRLEINMPLQVDCEPETYQKSGLPIAPICNPGLESIKAAIMPKDSENWYYLSTPEGETIFSKSLEKHNQAKRKYLQ